MAKKTVGKTVESRSQRAASVPLVVGPERQRDAGVPPVVVTDLAMLEAVHAREVRVEFEIEGAGRVVFLGRRLKPAECEPVARWLELALPRVVPGATPQDELRLDLEEKDYPGGYQARKNKCERTARALVIWCAFPVFREQARKDVGHGVPPVSTNIPQTDQRDAGGTLPLPKSDEEIAAFIEGRSLPDTLLERLKESVLKDEVRPALGFTSGSGFPRG